MNFNELLELILEIEEKPEDEEKKKKEKDEDSDNEKNADNDDEEKSPEEKADDAEENFEPEDEEEEDEMAELQKDIDAKFEDMGNKVMDNIRELLDKKPGVIIQKFQKLGQDEAIQEYLEQKFIPELEDEKDKMFVTLNMDDFIMYITQKISIEYLKKDNDLAKTKG